MVWHCRHIRHNRTHLHPWKYWTIIVLFRISAFFLAQNVTQTMRCLYEAFQLAREIIQLDKCLVNKRTLFPKTLCREIIWPIMLGRKLTGTISSWVILIWNITQKKKYFPAYEFCHSCFLTSHSILWKGPPDILRLLEETRHLMRIVW
jgi:hypothetical protein